MLLLCLLPAELWHRSQMICRGAKDPQQSTSAQTHLPKSLPPLSPAAKPAHDHTPSSAALQKHIKAGILQCVCKPQQIRLAFPRGEVKLHASNLTFHTSGGAPAARSLLQNVDLLDLSCRRRTTITSVPREDAGTNTFLRG